MREHAKLALVLAVILLTSAAFAQPATPGYPERVLQWTVKNGETCDEIAEALYGSATHRALIERYNPVRCQPRVSLPDGTTLVVPERATALPTARLRSLHPDVRARPPGGAWAPAEPGMALHERHSVNTLEKARADILFVDRTRVVLGEHTLVVIYDTAKQTQVARTPPNVELERGEVQAGLAALRGKAVAVDTQGGHVSASSADTVVRSKGQRATVSVFDGSTQVSSAGKAVGVPKNHGTSFRRSAPPTPPRPLPAAPRWSATSSEGVLLSAPGKSRIVAGWDEVPNSAAYRIEVARDAEFVELVLREETPARVRAFRAEGLPPGAYFIRVRAIDRDDFLGIASQPRALVLVEARLEHGRVLSDRIELSRYGTLRFTDFDGLELALDRGPFANAAQSLDPLELAPSQIALRVRGMGMRRYRVRYLPASARIATEQRADSLKVSVRFSGLGGIDIGRRVQPALWVTSRSGSRRRFAFDGNWTVSVPARATRALHVLDARGAVLGGLELSPALAAGTEHDRTSERGQLGVSAPLVSPSPLENVGWWSPARADAVAANATGYLREQRFGSQLSALGSGSLGAFGLDALVMTPEVTGAPADGSAWFRLRWRSLRDKTARFELGPAAEVGIPLTTTSPGPRAGFGVAVGGAEERFTWLANVGGRARLADADERLSAPAAQGYLLLGSSYAALDWARIYALLDSHALDHPERDAFAVRGGLSAGAELGRSLFIGGALRVSPWDDAGGTLIGQLSIGIRDGR